MKIQYLTWELWTLQVVLNIGNMESNVESDDLGVVSKIWSSSDQRALATGSDELAGLYWFCLTPDAGTHLQYGVRDKQIMSQVIDRILTPRYFALKCESEGILTHITVDKQSTFMKTIDEANRLHLSANGEWQLAQATPNDDFTLIGNDAKCWTIGANNRVVMEESENCAKKHRAFLWRRLANGALRHIESGLCVQHPAAIPEGCGTELTLGPVCNFAVVFDNSLPSLDLSGEPYAGPSFYNAKFVHQGQDYCVHENPHFAAVYCTCSSGAEINWKASKRASGADSWCKPGYKTAIGDIPGAGEINGKGGNQLVSSCDECGELCNSEATCTSYECSGSELKCNLNTERDPTDVEYKDYMFCQKVSIPF